MFTINNITLQKNKIINLNHLSLLTPAWFLHRCSNFRNIFFVFIIFTYQPSFVGMVRKNVRNLRQQQIYKLQPFKAGGQK